MSLHLYFICIRKVRSLEDGYISTFFIYMPIRYWFMFRVCCVCCANISLWEFLHCQGGKSQRRAVEWMEWVEWVVGVVVVCHAECAVYASSLFASEKHVAGHMLIHYSHFKMSM